ncbi:MAG: hypothetical protein H7Y41_03460 [Hyphomonadaceae bacterium]|nr:hypothetical protein [Clostridia bacterium]
MKYTIGVDYGTLSGRALLVEVETGKEYFSLFLSFCDHRKRKEGFHQC